MQSYFAGAMFAQGTKQPASELIRESRRRLQREEESSQSARAGVLEGLARIERGEFAEGRPGEVFQRAFEEGRRRAKVRGFE